MYSCVDEESNKILVVANENASLEYLLGDATADLLEQGQWLELFRSKNLRDDIKDRLNHSYTFVVDGELPITTSIVSDRPRNKFFKKKERYMRVMSCWHFDSDISYLWCNGEKTSNQFI